MPFQRLLIANRGEIAVRIARAAADLGIPSVAVYSDDDAGALHTLIADDAVALGGLGVPAYLDLDNVADIAQETGCDAVHPGYGFLSENAVFARACEAAGLTFVGPPAEMLEEFGDKSRARSAAAAAGVPTLRGIDRAVTLEEAQDFLAGLGDGGALMIKAISGGGGRGSRAVTDASELPSLFERCRSEALSAFGNGDLYVEELVARARHIEVQIAADNAGHVVHLGERECSVQRRYQKVIEIAPAPALNPELRDELLQAAVGLALHTGYRNLGTFEFLVDASGAPGREERFAFIETNARLQVEHTVTEEVTGADLVQAQIQLAAGATLEQLGLSEAPLRRGFAVQARVNLETLQPDGTVKPGMGTLTAYDAPSGPGVRTDGFGFTGFTPSASFDSLLAKVIAWSPSSDPQAAVSRASRALSEFRIEGATANVPFLQQVLARPELTSGELHTRFVDEHLEQLTAPHEGRERHAAARPAAAGDGGHAGAQVDTSDPLALFAYDESVKQQQSSAVEEEPEPVSLEGPDGSVGLPTPMQGTIVEIQVEEGDTVRAGQSLVVMESMKLQHDIAAVSGGVVSRVAVSVGEVIREGYPIVYVMEDDSLADWEGEGEELDLDHVRDDLALLYERRAYTQDENRPEAVARRRKTGQRTARENIADLVDDGSFREFGPLVLAAQRARHSEQYLRERTPADGWIAGLAQINGDLFPPEKARCIAGSYDYTVLAGTQGQRNHYKQDRMFGLANRFRLPFVLFSEGGGGRPGDTGREGGVGIDTDTFTQWAKLSGKVPLVGINSGRCFAGNTALLACCDVIIATEDSTIGMGGPAMIEGGGLGIYTPEEIGPMSVQVPNGVVDLLVEDEAAAVEVAKKYLGYFQGDLAEWEEEDQRKMRHIVPENRVRTYDMRDVIRTLADKGSVLEIRRDFGVGIITAFVRIEGKPVGLIANNPHHLAGAIDSDGSDKGARFLQLCEAFGLPVISLMDTPGIMVGPDVERSALVRHCARMFVTGANLTVPMFGVIVRKSYGLGVQAMCGASSLVPMFTVAWPTAEFSGMNIEGAVKLGYRKDLAAIEDPEERRAKYQQMVDASYERAKAVNSAVFYGIDDVIDPAETRGWIAAGLKSVPAETERRERGWVDAW